MTPQIKKFSGILGDIDLYTCSFLLAGGKSIIEEQYDGKDPVSWYFTNLEQQDMKPLKTKTQTIKGKTYIWIEVEWDPSQINRDLSENSTSMEELVWKSFYYPCKSNTKEECLGLMVQVKEIRMNDDIKNPIYLNTLLDAIL